MGSQKGGVIMYLKGICIRKNPVKEPIRKFIVQFELSGEHPKSADEIFSIAKPLIIRAIWWLILALIGFARLEELDHSKA